MHLSIVKALAMLTYLLIFTGPANAMTIQRAIDLSLNDELRISYAGSSEVYVLTSNLPQDVFVTSVQNSSGSGGYGGLIYVKLIKAVQGSYDYVIAFYSINSYVVNISLIKGGSYLSESLNCPANITLQLIFKLLSNSSIQEPQPIFREVPAYITPTIWSLVIMATFTSLFMVTAFLDVRDYSRIKRDRWSIQESIALTARYLLYGSLISFIASSITSLAITAYSNMVYGSHSFNPSSVVIPLTLLIASAIAYGICKWKGWYDVIDEE